jgi:ABC-type oligopeptide transport system substrate-binding subunit
MKKCKECNKDFEPTTNKGSEQLYCTKTCGRIASQKRHKQRLINKIYEEAKEKRESMVGNSERIEQSPEPTQSVGGIRRGEISATNDGRVTSYNPGKDYLELYYEAKIENNFYKLKNETLEKRVLELERKIFDLNTELDELDQGEEGGMLGSLMEQFKKDPVNSVKFVSSVIDNLMKPKR